MTDFLTYCDFCFQFGFHHEKLEFLFLLNSIEVYRNSIYSQQLTNSIIQGQPQLPGKVIDS